MLEKFKARLFNKEAAKPASKPDEILEILNLEPGQSVADIGSGGGYFALRFAKAVGTAGVIYAVDTNQGLLDIIRQYAKDRDLVNIKMTLAQKDHAPLPEQSVDLIFTRDSYHHLPNRVSYFRGLAQALREGGRVVIIDYKPGNFFRKLFGHFTDPDVIIKEMQQAGYQLASKHTILSKQSFLIFSHKL